MTKIINSNLFNSDVGAYIHIANCFHKMGTGIALQIKKQFPDAYKADLKTKFGDINKLGTYSVAYIPKKNLYIYNLYGQYHYSHYERMINYEAFYKGLTLILHDCRSKSITSVGMPYKCGCNNAGGNWNIVYTMIQEVSELFKVDVLVCCSDIEQQFHKIFELCHNETQFMSSTSDMVENTYYKQLIKLGPDIIPFLIDKLAGCTLIPHFALTEITKVDICKDATEDYVTTDKLNSLWKTWWEQKYENKFF